MHAYGFADQTRVSEKIREHRSATDYPHRLQGNTSITYPWIRSGILSGTALIVLCIVAIRPVRDRNYQFFLVAHGVLALCGFCIPVRITIDFSTALYWWVATSTPKG